MTEATREPAAVIDFPIGEEAAVRARGLTVVYPGRAARALDGIDLDVADGGTVGVHGRTGAGKSTLALALAGFLPRVVRATVSGTLRVAGADPVKAPAGELLGRVGIVFATPANQLSASKLSVREELAFGLENLGVPRDEMDHRIDETLDRLGIAALADRDPFALSGGEQQRVAIASIVAMGTRALVLDEPTAQLDPAATVAVARLLADLAAAGSTIVAAEHDPAVLAGMGRVLVLDAGRAVADALPGRALAPDVLAAIGLEPPTLVRLAAAAGLPDADAFDEERIAAGLERMSATGPVPTAATPTGAVPAGSTSTPTTWRPVTERDPVSIEADAVVHRYPTGLEAIRGVTLVVRPGETVAIVGQNGSGKTTLVKHLNGLLRPAAGAIRIDGRDIAGEPVDRLAATVGFVFQNPDDQLFERSVEREVAFGPRTIGRPAVTVPELVAAAVAATGLDDARKTNPHDLDLSRRKLVALASVLAIDPVVLVLDEPTTGQDGPGVARVGAIVDDVARSGRTVIAITHDMEFAARHFARIVVMRDGQIVLDGPPATVFGPANTQVLASTGLVPPPAARIAARLGLDPVPLEAESLLAMLGVRPDE